MNRRAFLHTAAAASLFGPRGRAQGVAMPHDRPNILFCISDDQSWAHTSAMGDPVVRTPVFDRVAEEGVLFTHCFCSSPSCTPSRGAILTGRNFWELDEGALLWSTLATRFSVYPDLLADAGYFVGLMKKGWGPGDQTVGGWTRNPAGPGFKSFAEFLQARPGGQPFCFWFGSFDPHRPYEVGSGVARGMDPAEVRLPPFLPDAPEIRRDICDYYFEIERYDRDIGEMLALLEQSGQLDNTLVVITSDNGMPFPRAKTNLYDFGARMPLAVRWPARVPGGRRVTDFISHTDLAPTFVEACGVELPEEMTGRSFLDVLTSSREGRVDPTRDCAFTGRERHVRNSDGGGYPCRAIRTDEYLYIRNLKPERWPAGEPPDYGDVDGGPTRTYMLEHRDEDHVARCFELGFGQRSEEELYDLNNDPNQLTNVADRPDYASVRQALRARLEGRLTSTGDRRLIGGAEMWETLPYYGRPER
jgi:uncharacterized sulfatase